MTDRLICAVDATPKSAGVVCAATAIGRALGLRTVLVHVAEPARDGSDSGRAPAAAELERSLAGLPLPPDAVRRIEVGDPAELIIAAAHDERAALIVTGTRATGPRAKALFGSVAARVVELAPTPIVIVPPGRSESAAARDIPSAREVIIAVDGSRESHAVTAFVGGLARRARAALVLAHVVPPAASAAAPPVGIVPPLTEPNRTDVWRVLDRARRQVPDPDAVELELRHGIPARELEELARERGADLIALGTSRPGRLRRALVGSLGDELAASSRRLLMVVPHDVARHAVARDAELQAANARG